MPSTSPTTRSDTETNTPSRIASSGAPTPLLILLLECERPLAPSIRWSLHQVHEVRLGRANDFGDERREVSGRMELAIGIPDGRMSSRHARLSRELGRWVIEDDESKNGVLVNGVLQRRAVLSPGDVIELGHTFFLYAERPATTPVPARSAARADAGPDSLETFVPEVADAVLALSHVSPSPVPVLLRGETGTGKELTARAVHRLSGRTGPFIAVNCGALPQTLIESELFGHRQGAFTGANEEHPGRLRSAAGGTLFLEEIGDLPLPAQAAFLRVLQEAEVLPVGASQPVKVDVRVVAATQRDPDALVKQGQFRSDLLARLSGLTVRLPPLRERREDLGLLIGRLLRRVATEPGRIAFTREAARALLSHRWPLNVRELEKSLSVAAVLAGSGRIDVPHLPETLRTARPFVPSAAQATPQPIVIRELSAEDTQRRERLRALLEQHRGNISAIAREMDVARMQIQRWLKRYGLDPERFRG